MKCLKCQTENPTDNKFCRECGTALAPQDAAPTREEIMRRQAKVAELLADALRLRDKGLYKEALPFAEDASRLMPESARALGLLTSLYEHEGQWDRAIFSMERLVALNPDSIADREKLAELRRRAHQPAPAIPDSKPIASERSSRVPAYLPLVLAGGVAAVVFFSCLPLVMHKASAEPAHVAVNNSNPAMPEPAPSFDPVTPLKQSAPPDDAPSDPFMRQRPTAPPSVVVSQANVPIDLPTPTARRARRPSPTSIPFSPVLPMPVSPPSDAGNANASNVANDNTASAADGAGFGNGGRISVRPPTAGESNSAAPSNSNNTIQVTPVQNNDSYIYIKVHPAPVSHGKDEQGSSDSGGSAQSSIGTPAPGTNNDMERARYLQGSGHYAEAIRAYRDAMSSGVRGEAYQGIAQSYQWMGDSESARASYKEAIHAYEQERTNRPYLAQRGIASCEAALMLLGG